MAPQLPQQGSWTLVSERWLNRGQQLFAEERFDAAVETWKDAAQRFELQGDFANQALTLNYMSLAYQELGRWAAAQDSIDRSLRLLARLPDVEPILWAKGFNTEASLLFALGKTRESIDAWDQAVEYYQRSADLVGEIGVRINQAQAWQSLGFYRRARNLLSEVEPQLKTLKEPGLRARALYSLGVNLQQLGAAEDSWSILSESLSVAQQHHLTDQIGPILFSLGSVASDRAHFPQALDYFRRSEVAALDVLGRLEAQLSQLRLTLEPDLLMQQVLLRRRLVPSITRLLQQAPVQQRSIYSSINFIESLLEIPQVEGTASQTTAISQDGWVSNAQMADILDRALAMAEQLADRRAEAYVLAQQGKLAHHDGDHARATRITEQALAIAQSLQADDIVAQASFQLGRLRLQQGQRTFAIAAYRQAITALQSLRGDIASIKQDVQFSFRNQVEPVYRELVALLLSDPHPTQAAIKEARDLIEGLQVAELDNFFKEACADVQPVNIEKIDPDSAIVYPILLDNRAVIIVSRPRHPFRLYSVVREKESIKKEIDQILEKLSIIYDSQERNQETQKLYKWLIEPAEKDLAFENVQTLVFVLGKELRHVPMAVLYDGQQYLVEKYRLALSPGLQLLTPRPLIASSLNVFSAGISQSRQGFPPLPAVKTEINKITESFNNSVLLDDAFTRPKLGERLTESSTSIVHLATHAQFSSNVEQTFLLTWEDRLKLTDFSQLLGERDLKQSKDIELLVLSACQTAVGDDRAILGLAGFAVRSGARSTLATLWAVRDNATAQFMDKFYQYLRQPGITKAEALQKAQLALINDPRYDDPFYWAPFVLIGNWL